MLNDAIGYRKDIDGLRAVAIFSVLFAHVNLNGFTGGFIGVDVFFVISGFLITKIISKEISEGSFSLARFYERRARRILPALYVVLAAVLVFSLFYEFPNEIIRVMNSEIMSILFISNIYFYMTTNYFSDWSGWAPLLHTWSLGVEEQYYIVFPLIMRGLNAIKVSRPIYFIVAIALVSFAIDYVEVKNHYDSGFYLLPGRAWELMIGGLLSYDLIPKSSNRLFREFISLTAMAALAWSVHRYSAATEFPAASALVPCLSAAALIYAGGEGTSFAKIILSSRPFVYIGKISYSLYLWHWPVVVYYKLIFHVYDLELFDSVVVILISIVLAHITVIAIENPFRLRRVGVSRKALAAYGVASAAALGVAVVGVLMALATNTANLTPAQRVATYLTYDDRPQFRRGQCFLTAQDIPERDFDPAVCLKVDAGRPNTLLIGDSHAAHLWYGLNSVLRDTNVMQATAAGCKPFPSDIDARLGQPGCVRFYKSFFERLRAMPHLDSIIIAARWMPSDIAKIDQLVAYFGRYADKVTVVGPTVEYVAAAPRILAERLNAGQPPSIFAFRKSGIDGIDKDVESAAVKSGAQYISAYRTLCPAQDCKAVTDAGVPIQFDYGHLTDAGSSYVVSQWVENGFLVEKK